MSFEVNYLYYDKVEDSFEYDKTNSKSFTKVYGKLDEDYPYEKLIAQINSQYARRDIFVYDTVIYEFQKKKISFKQIKDGFVLKNKKYNLKNVDEGNLELVEVPEFVETTNNAHLPERNPVVEPAQIIDSTPNPAPVLATSAAPIQQVKISPVVVKPKPRKVIKHVIFSPITPEMRRNFPYKFTPNKKYPIFAEKPVRNGIGIMYDTIDDLGQDVTVPDEPFVMDDFNLKFGDEFEDFSPNKNSVQESKLNWSGIVEDVGVPKLR